MELDRTFDDGRVQTANVAVCTQKHDSRFNLHVQRKTIFKSSDIDETADTGVFDERRQQSFTQAAPNELKLGDER